MTEKNDWEMRIVLSFMGLIMLAAVGGFVWAVVILTKLALAGKIPWC